MSLVAYKRRAEATTHNGETFEKLDLRSMLAMGSKWKDCTFVECNFDLADVHAAQFEKCAFRKCSMRMMNLQTTMMEDVTFGECDMEGASMMGAYLRLVVFVDCRMAYSTMLFQDATVKEAVLIDGCNLHGSNLDFREVEAGALSFRDCNLWSAKMSMGCAIWGGNFDERLVKQFLALVGRVSRDPRVIELAGEQFAIVNRAMDGAKKWDQGSMTSPATTSSKIPNSPDQMEATATATTMQTVATMTTRGDP